jgi:hypothetical protein
MPSATTSVSSPTPRPCAAASGSTARGTPPWHRTSGARAAAGDACPGGCGPGSPGRPVKGAGPDRVPVVCRHHAYHPPPPLGQGLIHVALLVRSASSAGYGLDMASGSGVDHLTDLGLGWLRLDAGEHPCRSSGLPRVDVSSRGTSTTRPEGIIAARTCLLDLLGERGEPLRSGEVDREQPVPSDRPSDWPSIGPVCRDPDGNPRALHRQRPESPAPRGTSRPSPRTPRPSPGRSAAGDSPTDRMVPGTVRASCSSPGSISPQIHCTCPGSHSGSFESYGRPQPARPRITGRSA